MLCIVAHEKHRCLSFVPLRRLISMHGVLSFKSWRDLFELTLTQCTKPEDHKLARPTLIVVPVHIVDQWIVEIESVARRVFRVFRYHGDHRLPPVGDEDVIKGHLNENHYLFSTDNEDNARAIVAAAYGTLACRHGPQQLKAERVNERMDPTEAQQRSTKIKPD